MTHFDPGRGERRTLPAVVKFTPLQQDVIKLLALALMVLDHANRALGLDSPTLLLLGRGAFPLFALVWGVNLARRPVRQAQATRLWGWALLAQPGYWLVMRHDGFTLYEPNILFLFAVVTQALAMAHWPVRQGSPNGWVGGALLLALWGYYAATPGTYGVDGLLLLLASYGLCVTLPPTVSEAGGLRGLAIVSWPILALRLNAGLGHSMMLSGLLLPTLLIAGALAVVALCPLDPQRRLLKAGFFLQAYVGHLLALGLVAGWAG